MSPTRSLAVRRPRPAERGVALVWVIAMMLALAFAASVLTAGVLPLIRESSRSRASLQAFYAAEGALSLARARLARDPSFTSEAMDLSRGRAEARVEAVPGSPDRRLVHARGTAPGEDARGSVITRGITATVRLEAGRLPVVVAYGEE